MCQTTATASAQYADEIFIICFLFDPNVGGPTVRARAVYERMIAEGHRVRVAFPNGKGTAYNYLKEAGITVDQLSAVKPVLPSKPMAFLKFVTYFPVGVWKTTSYLRRHKPDVIHVNGAFDLGPALAGRMARVPVVWHLNDTLFGERLSRQIGTVVTRVANVVVAAAGAVASHYGVKNERTHIVFAPVDVKRFRPRSPIGYPRSTPVIGLLANWNWIKGQDRFVEVVAKLRERGRTIKGRSFGRLLDSQKGFWEPIVSSISERGLDEVIERLGFVAAAEDALRDLDILVVTSRSEASPMCVLEAMAIGIPQVVFDVGGVREMLGEGEEAAGIIVDEGDIEAMVAGVEKLLDEPSLYEKMSKNGQRRANAHFSLEICVGRHEAAYRAAISSGRVAA